MTALVGVLRAMLDRLYHAGGVAAAACLVLMLAAILMQMASRWTGVPFPGSAEYAGYLMAAASFLALADALNRGAHIRVSLLLARLGRWRRAAEIWCFTIGTALSAYLAWYAVKAVYWSHKLGDVSQGQDATPLWIPQLGMAAGALLLAVAFLDHLVRLVVLGAHGIVLDAVEQAHVE